MSFTRVHTWAANEKLTSSQMNSVAGDLANALDKTGDSITVGTITVSGGGLISVTSAAGIQSNVPGGIMFAGGATDYGTLSPARSITRRQPMIINQLQTGWTYSVASVGAWVSGPGTTQIQAAMLTDLENGATLASVSAFVTIIAHGSLPAVFPTLNVYKLDMENGVVYPPTSWLNSTAGAAVFPTPANTTAYVNGGLMQSWTATINAGTVIDKSKYTYFAVLTDESGGGAVANNAYFGFSVAMTGITTLQPG